jgi:type I restriction enzyme S subunit
LIEKVESGGTPSTTVEEYWDGDIPWLTPKEITGFTDNLFVSRTERMISEKGLSDSAAKLLPPGTVMLSKRAPVGAVAVNAVPMSTNQGFLNFRCGSELRPLYLAYWFRANAPYLHLIANGSTYPELYVGDLFEFEIAVPPLKTQDNIIELLSAIQFVTGLGLPLEQSVTTPEHLFSMQEQNRRLAIMKDAILPLLLSGELDVSEIKSQFTRPK